MTASSHTHGAPMRLYWADSLHRSRHGCYGAVTKGERLRANGIDREPTRSGCTVSGHCSAPPRLSLGARLEVSHIWPLFFAIAVTGIGSSRRSLRTARLQAAAPFAGGSALANSSRSRQCAGMRRTLSPLFFSFALAATAVLASSCFTDSCACVTVPPARQDRWIRLTPLRDSLDLTLDPGLLLARTIGAIDAIDAGRPDDARALVTALNATGPWLGQVAYSLGMAGDTVAARATIRDL